MQRYFLKLAYNGSNYHGWQIQKNAHSVQAILNEVLGKRCRQDIEVTGAGRTDTGVHAQEMYCHFDLNKPVSDAKDFIYHMNGMLPKDIAVQALLPVKPEAHARFDATSRSYVYQIHFEKDPFREGTSWYCPFKLDVQKMNKSCAILKKHSDFSCFSKSRTQTKTNLCKISNASWKESNGTLAFEITADRFLRNMVRAIVGTMVEIGKGSLNEKELEAIILSKDRRKAGVSVPAHGLFLTKVKYPNKIFIN